MESYYCLLFNDFVVSDSIVYTVDILDDRRENLVLTSSLFL